MIFSLSTVVVVISLVHILAKLIAGGDFGFLLRKQRFDSWTTGRYCICFLGLRRNVGTLLLMIIRITAATTTIIRGSHIAVIIITVVTISESIIPGWFYHRGGITVVYKIIVLFTLVIIIVVYSNHLWGRKLSTEEIERESMFLVSIDWWMKVVS